MSADLKEAREQIGFLERDNTALYDERAALKASQPKGGDACRKELQVSAQQGAKVCRKL